MYSEKIIIDGLQYCYWDRAYFQSLKDSGITAVHVTLVYHESARETLSLFAKWNRFFAENKDLIIPVTSAQDIKEAKGSGKVGIFFGAQNCSVIDDEIGLVEVMRNQGLLIMQLTYNNQSLLATGCYEKNDNGVTRFGKQVIEQMNRVGMIIDMSHSAERSTLETIELSSRPICISHANPSFFHNGLRNKSTQVIKALAARKGLLGLSVYPFHLPKGCTIKSFCQMVADTAELIGVDHLGIGSDLCSRQPEEILTWMRNGRWSESTDYGEGSKNNASWPEPCSWFYDSYGMKNLYTGLKEQGFNDQETEQVLGLNWYRFLQNGLNKWQ